MPGPDPNAFDDDEITSVTVSVPGAGKETIAKMAEVFTQ